MIRWLATPCDLLKLAAAALKPRCPNGHPNVEHPEEGRWTERWAGWWTSADWVANKTLTVVHFHHWSSSRIMEHKNKNQHQPPIATKNTCRTGFNQEMLHQAPWRSICKHPWCFEVGPPTWASSTGNCWLLDSNPSSCHMFPKAVRYTKCGRVCHWLNFVCSLPRKNLETQKQPPGRENEFANPRFSDVRLSSWWIHCPQISTIRHPRSPNNFIWDRPTRSMWPPRCFLAMAHSIFLVWIWTKKVSKIKHG